MKNSENTPPATSRIAWLLYVVVFGYLWFILINQLRVLWVLEPQYSYGWAVPFMCAYLIWQKVTDHRLRTTDHRPQTTDHRPPCLVNSAFYTSLGRPLSSSLFHLPSSIHVFLFALLAFLYLPVRLVQAANPVWTLVSWGLALVVIGLTLWFLYFNTPTLQRFNLSFRDLVFPICFFLVAVPWPSVIESPLIQGLTRADAGATAEVIGWFGVPAMAHGNVIEVATGQVGIADACSGIRSFQATLMIALFLGEFYSLCAWRRALFVVCGFAMSLGFNLARMSVLVWVAANHGIAAIEQWHDPAGITILLACFFGLWGLGVWLRQAPSAKRQAHPSPEPTPTPGHNQSSIVNRKSSIPLAPPAWPLFALAAWIVLTEIGVASWYGIHEAHLPPAQQWTISWPTNNPTFKEQPIEPDALQTLKCDENRRAGWQEDSRQWQTIFLCWNPGTLVQLAHTPEKCMTAAGHTLTTVANCEWFDADGLRLPFSVFEVTDTPQPFFIFYCLWNDQLSAMGSKATSLWLSNNRLAPVLTGMRNTGYRSLEIMVGGVNSAGEAESAVRAELGKILVVTNTPKP